MNLVTDNGVPLPENVNDLFASTDSYIKAVL